MSSIKRRKPAAAKAKPRPAPQAPGRRFPIGWVAGGIVAVGLIALIIASVGSGDVAAEYGTPQISGSALGTHMDETPAFDPAVGIPAPEVSGADWRGTEVGIQRNGNAKAIVFLAHWCGHCQNEVPVVQAYLDLAELPAGLEVVSVATLMDPVRNNYPTSDWLEREGWTPPVIMDDEQSSVAAAYGLRATPYWVFVNGDGNVVRRHSGETNPADLAAWLEEAAAA